MLPQQRQSLIAGCCARRASNLPRRSGWQLAAGALSLGVWLSVPKCPVCVAAHVALWTGLGITLAQAAYLRWSLFALSGALLTYVIVKCAFARRIRAAS